MISLKVIWNQGLTLEIRAPYLQCIHFFIPNVISRLCSTPKEQDFSSKIPLGARIPLQKCLPCHRYIMSWGIISKCWNFSNPGHLKSHTTAKPIMKSYAVGCFCILHTAVFSWASLDGAPSYTNREQRLIKTWTHAVYKTTAAAVCMSAVICYCASDSGDLHTDPIGGSSGPYMSRDWVMMIESLDFKGYMGCSVQNETCGSGKISLYLVIKSPGHVMENKLNNTVE